MQTRPISNLFWGSSFAFGWKFHVAFVRTSSWLGRGLGAIKHKQSAFPFLRLPIELRLQIYHLVLDFKRLVINHSISDGRLRRQGLRPVETQSIKEQSVKELTSLTLLNRQTRQEALPVLYANEFDVSPVMACVDFLQMIAPPCIPLLKRVDSYISEIGFRRHGARIRQLFHLLAHATYLRSLTIWHGQGNVAFQLQRHVHHMLGFLLAYQKAHGGDIEAGLEVMNFPNLSDDK